MDQRRLPLRHHSAHRAGGRVPRRGPRHGRDRGLQGLRGAHDEHKNYKSFAEEAAAADEDLERIVGEGFAEKFESAAAVVQRFGAFVPAKVAVQAKLRKDGSKKIRLIVDMRRDQRPDNAPRATRATAHE